MTTPSKRATPAPARRTPRRTEVADSAPRPFLRFYHSPELREKTLSVLITVESSEDAVAHSGHLTELVLELVDSGMDQYFLQSLKAAKASFVVQQSAALGLAGVRKVIGTVTRNILVRMDDRQLRSVCASIRQFML